MPRSSAARERGDTSVPERPDGYDAYAEFIEKLLDAQEARKASLEQRGLSVITTSGTLVTLLFAVLGLATRGASTFTIPDDARPWLLTSTLLFVLAAVAAICVNLPLLYRGLEVPDFAANLERSWREDGWTAAARVTQTRLDMLTNAQFVNGLKAWTLVAAMSLEAGALVPLAVVVFQITG